MKTNNKNSKLAAGKRRVKEKSSKLDILDHIENIVNMVKDGGLENPSEKLNIHANFVAKKLDITPLQAILFSLFVEKNSEPNITLQDIAKVIGCNNIKILKYSREIDALESKKLIRCRKSKDGVYYRVPYEVCEALKKNAEYKAAVKKDISIDELFAILSDMFDERQSNELSFETLTIELMELMLQNKHLKFCKKILSYNLPDFDFVLLTLFCHLSGNNDDDNIRDHDYDFIYEDKVCTRIITRNLSKGEHTLFAFKLIEHNNENGFVDTDSIRLTDKAKKELLSELGKKNSKKYSDNILTKFDSIKLKNLYFNPKETEAVTELTSLLQEENYKKIIKRLDKKGMRKGFACLFSGAPGTGKTETAYQIARVTKRNIMIVDISETKSCWFGESEKRIKKVFDDYREAVENSKLAPILVFNEADAVISKRRVLSGSRSGPDQTENAIQNIILQEMENLKGILIATTNLTQNMDPAFERRFLYKIVFDKPSPESRFGIWKSMIPDLPETHIQDLSKKYELSGGQIENIARKVEVDSILKGEQSWINSLSNYCREELDSGFNSTEKRIGFAV